MFSGVMANAWIAGTVIAVVGGTVGFFVVLRGATFAAHAVPLSSFAGAAGANLVGASPIAGLALFAPVAAISIGWLSRRRRSDVVTALVVASMLGLGALFLSWSVEYAPEIYALLFGQILAVSTSEVWVTVGLAVAALLAVAVMYRPLLLTSVTAQLAESRGVRPYVVDMLFLLLVAVVTTTAVPVVGTLLLFTLMVGPAAAARAVMRAPLQAVGLGVAVACVTIWGSIAASYLTTLPIGFFVGVAGAVWYVAGRAWAHRRR